MQVFLLLVGLLVLAPGVGMWLGAGSDGKAERRTLAEFPKGELFLNDRESWQESFQLWFNDQMGFRPLMVGAGTVYRQQVLGATDLGAVLGTAGPWLFYQEEGVLQDFAGQKAFTTSELERLEQNLLAEKRWLREQGIHFLLVVPPNKMSVYSEYVPGNVRPFQSQQSRLAQLNAVLENHHSLAFLNLLPLMQQAKAEQQVYYYTDTHWNDWGAFQASQAIREKVKPWYPNIELHTARELGSEVEAGFSGDLARLISQSGWRNEDRIRYSWKRGAEGTEQKFPALEGRANYRHFKGTNPKGPRLLMFQDSFGFAIDPFLAEGCSEALFVFDHGNHPEIIASFHPDLVIRQVVERQLFTLLNLKQDQR